MQCRDPPRTCVEVHRRRPYQHWIHPQRFREEEGGASRLRISQYSAHYWEKQTIGGAEHLVIGYPLWLSTRPGLLKAFLEQVFRPGFALAKADAGQMGQKLLTGKSARIVVTMGMPAWVYRWYFRAHSLKSLERNILNASMAHVIYRSRRHRRAHGVAPAAAGSRRTCG